MTRTMVALDLETTGLDSSSDAIIEVGAVKFSGDEEIDVFDELINPGRKIPPYVTQLTSIDNEMVSTKPSIHDKISELKNFVGNAPIVGHNIQFDLKFLSKYNLFQKNDRIDTMHLAACVLPCLSFLSSSFIAFF